MSTARIIISLLVVFVFACNSKPERPAPVLDANYQAPATDTAAPAATPEPDQNASGVWHYTCSNGCAGGAGSAVACATCGTTLVHNTEYHNSAAPNTTTTTLTPGSDNIITPPSATPAATPTPEPAQNTAGVWHYTCANGCAGGAGAAGTCAGCGGALAHNTGYHN